MAQDDQRDEIVIERVEVAFEVEGDDRAVFERYFHAAMRRWEAERSQRESQEQRAATERRLGANTRGWGGSS